jgi:hypothetical protein
MMRKLLHAHFLSVKPLALEIPINWSRKFMAYRRSFVQSFV